MYSTIFIGQPQPAPVPISLDAFEDALRERCPEVQIVRLTLGGSPCSMFNVTLDGQPRGGQFSTDDGLILNDGDGALWAETIEWFLTLIPGYEARMLAEVSYPTSAPIPGHATAAEIEQIYQTLTSGLD